jgi:hypothetical protein
MLYARVSTDEQADREYSLQSQIDACGKYAHDSGFELVLEKLQASMDSLDERYTKLTTERDRLIADLGAGSQLSDEPLAWALQFCADIVDGLYNPTFDDKQLYLELLQVAVTVKGGRAIIRCTLPIEPCEVDLSGARLTSILTRA